MSDLKQKVVKGTIWAMLERFSTQFVSFGVTLVLARLLTPGDYGTVALLSIFVTVASELADSGLGAALIQKKNADELDFNSVFYASLVLSGIFYGILFVSAPAIARFYNVPQLVPIVRVISVTLVFHAVNSVQNAELNRKLLFHLSFRISIISSIASAVVGVVLAFGGYGPWALVWSQVAGGFVGVLTRWFYIAWHPRWMFSFSALGGLFQYGWKIMAASLLDKAYDNFYGLVIGKIYSKESLAFVNRGENTPRIAMDPISGTLSRIAFPVFAQVQDERERFREALSRMIRLSSFVIFPLMVGCAVCAEELVYVMFGEKWLPCVPYLYIGCFAWALMPVHSLNLQAIKASGRSGLFFNISLVKKLLGLACLAATYKQGVVVMVLVCSALLGPVFAIINAWPNRRYLNYSLWQQFVDLVPSIVSAATMGGAVWTLGLLLKMTALPGMSMFEELMLLAVKVVVGILFFMAISFAFKLKSAQEILRLLVPSVASRLPLIPKSFRDVAIEKSNRKLL